MEKDVSTIIPTRKNSQKKLKEEHIYFIKFYVEKESEHHYALRDLRENLLKNFPDLENVGLSTIEKIVETIGILL